jgi:hypothetical protein
MSDNEETKPVEIDLQTENVPSVEKPKRKYSKRTSLPSTKINEKPVFHQTNEDDGENELFIWIKEQEQEVIRKAKADFRRQLTLARQEKKPITEEVTKTEKQITKKEIHEDDFKIPEQYSDLRSTPYRGNAYAPSTASRHPTIHFV